VTLDAACRLRAIGANLLTLLLLAGCGTAELPDAAAPRPNVILISIDALRADHLGLYGYGRPTSPNLDALTQEAVVFERAFNVAGFTLSVHMSMLTSLPPGVHGVQSPGIRGIASEDFKTLPPGRITLAEQLAEHGYRTAAFTDAPWVGARFGFDQGFDVYDEQGLRIHSILPRALRWLQENPRQPFFLFLHAYDVHSRTERLPYDCPDGSNDLFTAGFEGDFDGCIDGECASNLLRRINAGDGGRDPSAVLKPDVVQYIVGLYDGCIHHVDNQIATLLDRLRAQGVYDNSLIVITSDHGEEFLDHGKFLHVQAYDELARIPLIVKFPQSRWGGRRIGQMVSVLDYMPTILDVLDIPANDQVQGMSLVPLIERGQPGRDIVHLGPAVRTERWKYMARSQELYDLAADPGETTDVSASHPEIAAELLRRHREFLRRDRELRGAFEKQADELGEMITLDEDTRAKLRSLGYLN
jgi:arylsulfatase A-like enzyme